MTYASVQGASVYLTCQVTMANTGQTVEFPVVSTSIRYGLNRVPQASIIIPYGSSSYGWWDDIKTIPSALYSHRVKIYYTFNGNSPILLFDGFMTALTHTRSAGRGSINIATQITATGWLGLVSAQLTSILRGESPTIYAGNPWFSNAVGVYVGGIIDSISSGATTISTGVIDALRYICSYQDDYDIGYEAGESGAAMADSALSAHQLATHPATAINSSYDWDTRYDISREVLNSLTEPGGQLLGAPNDMLVGGNLLTGLLAFCEKMGFALVPMVSYYALVPICYPGYAASLQTNHPIVHLADIEEYSTPTSDINMSPLHGVVMVDHNRGGYWGLIDEQEIIATYDISSMYSTSAGKFGRVIRYPKPQWFPSYGSGLSVASRLCEQVALNEAFGRTQMYISIPYIYNTSPGSLFEVRGNTSFPSLGGSTVFGVAQGIEYNLTIDPTTVRTKILLSHVMNSALFSAGAMRDHPVASGYFLYSTMY